MLCRRKRAAVAKQGEILEYAAPKEGQLPQWLVQEAARIRLTLGLPEARLLAQRCGDNQNILLRELEKLKSYVDDGRVTAEDVRLLSTRTIEASIFDLLDNLALGRGAEAFAVAEELLVSRRFPRSRTWSRPARGRRCSSTGSSGIFRI